MAQLDTIVARLRGANIAKLRKVAAQTGVPFTTVWKIARGETQNPRYDTVQALAKYRGR